MPLAVFYNDDVDSLNPACPQQLPHDMCLDMLALQDEMDFRFFRGVFMARISRIVIRILAFSGFHWLKAARDKEVGR